jgi:hypothetical protein
MKLYQNRMPDLTPFAAIQWMGNNFEEVKDFIEHLKIATNVVLDEEDKEINLLYNTMQVSVVKLGDWIRSDTSDFGLARIISAAEFVDNHVPAVGAKLFVNQEALMDLSLLDTSKVLEQIKNTRYNYEVYKEDPTPFEQAKEAVENGVDSTLRKLAKDFFYKHCQALEEYLNGPEMPVFLENYLQKSNAAFMDILQELDIFNQRVSNPSYMAYYNAIAELEAKQKEEEKRIFMKE